MKKFLSVMLILVIGAVAFAYAVDYLCMQNGEEVMFFTWGKDYTPASNEQNTETPDKLPDIKTDTDKPRKNSSVHVNLYFSDESFMKLEKETREFDSDENLPVNILTALIEGPSSENIYPLLSPDAKVLSASVSDDGLCTVDLSREFCKFEGGSYMENMAISSVVNSLCSYDAINRVKINIEGEKDAIFGNHFSLEDVLSIDAFPLVG